MNTLPQNFLSRLTCKIQVWIHGEDKKLNDLLLITVVLPGKWPLRNPQGVQPVAVYEAVDQLPHKQPQAEMHNCMLVCGVFFASRL